MTVLIEIETPHKAWFYGDRAEIHSDLTHAHGQLAEWRAWFGRGHNRTAFLDYYDVPPELGRRQLSPRYVLVHGRRGNFESSPRRREKRAELARPDERLMSFDRLTPARNSVLYSAVRKGQDGYRVTSVPPSLTVFNTGETYRLVSGWDLALGNCPDMAESRRGYLKEQLALLISDPQAYVTATGRLRTRRSQWLWPVSPACRSALVLRVPGYAEPAEQVREEPREQVASLVPVQKLDGAEGRRSSASTWKAGTGSDDGKSS